MSNVIDAILDASGVQAEPDLVAPALEALERAVTLFEQEQDRESRLDPLLQVMEDQDVVRGLASAGVRWAEVEAKLSRVQAVHGFDKHARNMRQALKAVERAIRREPPGEAVAITVKEADKPDAGVWQQLDKREAPDGFRPRKNTLNLALILRNDPRWNGRVVFNELSQQREIMDSPLGEISTDFRPLVDVDEARAALWVQATYRMDCSSSMVGEVLAVIADDARYHPVREYLEGVEWDGTPRLDTWLSTYLGAADTPLHRAYARKWAISAVVRAMEPGAKVDTVLILVGGQGTKKSSAIRALCHEPTWFNDTVFDVNSKDAFQAVATSWIVELAELDSLRRGSARDSAVKAFLSARVDKFRPPYGRHIVDHPRQCVMVGTTNEDDFLADATGSRRFWPVEISEADVHGLARVRDQLWAEAVAAYRQRERWWLTDEEETTRVDDADVFEHADPWEAPILLWLQGRHGDWVTTTEVMAGALEMPKDRMDRRADARVAGVLRKAGWRPGRPRIGGSRVRAWRLEGA